MFVKEDVVNGNAQVRCARVARNEPQDDVGNANLRLVANVVHASLKGHREREEEEREEKEMGGELSIENRYDKQRVFPACLLHSGNHCARFL